MDANLAYTFGMRGKLLVVDLARQTALALALSALFAYGSAAPWPVSITVLLLAGPGTELILNWIRSKSGVEEGLAPAPRWFRWASVGWVVLTALFAVPASVWLHVGYWKAFAWTWLILTAAGSLNAIVAEWEDRRPGGFLNP